MPNIMIDEIFPLAMEFLHPIRSSRKIEQEKIISSPNSEKEKLNKVLKCIDRILWNFNLLLYRIVNDNIHFHYSDELLSKMLPKKLLSDNDQAQLFEIMKEIKNGESVISRMSRSQSKKDFIDNMFNNWQISHLHLSCEKHPKHQELKASTKNLLFFHILIQPNLSRADFFLLDILPHESISKPNKKLVEISYRNWPEVFFVKSPFMPDYKDRSFSSEDTAELWENGCSTHIRTSDDLILSSPMPVSTARITLTAKTLLDEHSQEIKLFLERALKS